MILPNSDLGPPPLTTPITAQGPDEFGVPFQARGLASGNLQIGWAAWFSGVWNRLVVLVDAVLGFSSLTNVNKLTKVTAAGTIGESGATDDGTTVYALSRTSIGVGAAAPGQATAGRRYLYVKGDTHSGGLDGSQGDADGNGVTVMILQATDTNSTEADKRIAAIVMSLLGTTANKRGGAIRLFVKTDAVSGLVQATQVDDTGATVVGKVDITGVYKVGGVQVVTTRQAALTATAPAGTAAGVGYLQATAATWVTLMNTNKTRLDEMEARLQAHGLIS